MNKTIRISAPGRIHVNLFDMSETGYRQNGGVGFSINSFDTIFEFEPSNQLKVIDQRQVGYSPSEKTSLLEFLNKLFHDNGYHTKFIIKILSGPPPHSGFGTGTITKLACAEAASLINDAATDAMNLVKSSGRGGTSGVGINTYFKGGISIDLGIKSQGLKFAPSSARQRPKSTPLQILHFDLPTEWRFGIVLSPNENKISAAEEIAFFNRTCPIQPSSVHESIYHAVSGMACAAIENDYLTFAASIAATQESEWKKAEWTAQSNNINSLRSEIQSRGAECVGLSSLGSTIYFMAKNIEEQIKALGPSPKLSASVASPNNSGRTLEID